MSDDDGSFFHETHVVSSSSLMTWRDAARPAPWRCVRLLVNFSAIPM
jgi:hypothetical protein